MIQEIPEKFRVGGKRFLLDQFLEIVADCENAFLRGRLNDE